MLLNIVTAIIDGGNTDFKSIFGHASSRFQGLHEAAVLGCHPCTNDSAITFASRQLFMHRMSSTVLDSTPVYRVSRWKGSVRY